MEFRVKLQALFLFIIIGVVFAPVIATDDANGKPLRFGVHASAIGKMDPHFAAASQDRMLADMLFNGLLRYEPGNAPKIEPDLAIRMPDFKIINGRQVWNFELKKGVLFHPGPKTQAYELTTDDVLYSLNKSKNKSFCAYSGSYSDMTFEKVDNYRFKILLENPLSSILFFPKFTNYAGGFIVSKKAIEKMGYEAYQKHPVGTGPFLFKENIPGEKLILKSHSQYFRGEPLLDGVELHFMQDFKKRGQALLDGQVDVIKGSGKPGWIESMEVNKDIVVDFPGVGEVATIYFNTTTKPFNDIKVRKAVAYALDRNKFQETVTKRFCGPIYSPVPAPFLPGGLTLEDVQFLKLEYAYDPVKARELLTQAGYPNGFTLDLVSSEKRVYNTYYNTLKTQLEDIGIQCNLKVMSHSAMHKAIRKKPLPLVIYAAWRPNADAYLSRFFHSDSIIVKGAKPDTNFSHYNKIDKIIEDARLEIDPEKQINLWKQAQIKVLNDMTAYPIMYTTQLYLKKASLDYGHILKSTMALYPSIYRKDPD